MSNWDSVANNIQFNLEIATTDFIEKVPTDSKILDFGCGYGRVADQLYLLGYQNLIGIDNSREMINRGLIEYPYLDLRFSDSTQLPFQEAEFDVVLTCAVFTCIDQQDMRFCVFNDLKRVVKQNGLIYMAEFTSPDSIRFVSKQGVPMWHSSHSELENLTCSMKIELSRQVETKTMSGRQSSGSHIIARKTI